MSIFKCKMCGGTIEFEEGASIGTCDHCGTKQTLPKLGDNERANLYDRANHFRRNNEYDKAMGIYEKILNEDRTDAEAYWSLVLCKYGVEYVEDPATHKRVPTVNRTQFTSVFDDEDYKSAIQYADFYQKSIYEEEAKAINEIQKGILAISSQEEPFDIFICYKEMGNDGRRTPDSVLAQELYQELTKEGLKVFFSRITLEDKLGTAYEPYIFAALNSAKVMVVVGTKPEYFNAVWVKNEWSRYLALIKSGARKTLIPAYRDMDPYDLPEEFSHLQAQDMSKLGFMQDLVRGVKKLSSSGTSASKSTITSTAPSVSAGGELAPLLKRVFMFLEDGDVKSANEYCERVLDIDPECGEAYLGKLMAGIGARNRASLASSRVPLETNANYQKVLRYGDSSLQNEIRGYNQTVIDRIRREKAEEEARLAKEKAEREARIKAAVSIMNAKYSQSSNTSEITDIQAQIDETNEALSALNTKIGSNNSQMCAVEKAKAEQQISELNKELSTLGLFKGARKREINDEIQKLQGKISSIQDIVDAIRARESVQQTLTSQQASLKQAQEEEARRLNSGIQSVSLTCEQAVNVINGLSSAEINSLSLPSVFKLKNGDKYKFGKYQWRVLAREGTKLLLITNDCVDKRRYNESSVSITWENCTLRKWLNTDFLNAFSTAEKSRIATTKVVNKNNPKYNTAGGNDTNDKVFLLSIDEAQKYFSSNNDRIAKYNGNTIWWWLRSPGGDTSGAAGVGGGGDVNYGGIGVNGNCGVCPALWINL